MNSAPRDVNTSSPTCPQDPAAPVWIKRGTAQYWRVSMALFLAGFATFSLLYCVQPLLPELAQTFAVSPAQSALALSVSTACLAASIVLAGALSEGLGRRKLMFISMALAALCNLVASFLPQWHALLAARALEGILLGGVPAVAMAYLSEEIDPKGLGFAMGLYVGGTALGGMLGRIGMSAMTEFWGWRHAMAALSVLDLLAAVGFVWLLPNSRNFIRKSGLGARYHLQAWGRHLRHKGLPLLFLIAFGLMGVFVSIYNYAGFLLSAEPYNMSQLQISHIFYAYLFGMVASPVAGGLADRLGRGPVLVAGALLMAAGVVLTLFQPLAVIVVGIVLLTAGFFVAHSVASGWVGRLATQTKGHASSLYLWGYYMGSSVLGAGAGWFWSRWGWNGVGSVSLLVLALVIALALRVQWLAQQAAGAQTSRV
ncbi:MFS transporter [Comamonas sp. Y6]|uniref:MFS transporter n=1 Tax=Comamonas resistens TaxID=3046670 RepID=A0ABY8SW33_9BURK|nr:MFS transporter [Comamonas resistens]MDL5036010.1 MFS transporter [Comamonas resistens]WHS66109.1 MFS transporter [Comamonas resistens]